MQPVSLCHPVCANIKGQFFNFPGSAITTQALAIQWNLSNLDTVGTQSKCPDLKGCPRFRSLCYNTNYKLLLCLLCCHYHSLAAEHHNMPKSSRQKNHMDYTQSMKHSLTLMFKGSPPTDRYIVIIVKHEH